MNKDNLSLCIPCYNYNENKVDSSMWRIADYSEATNEFISAIYTSEGDSDFFPRKLGVDPYTAKAFKPSIYSWTRNEDGKVRSADTGKCPIEIVKSDVLAAGTHNSFKDIRDVLYAGFEIYEYVSEVFLLVVNEDEFSYDALLLKRKMSCSTDNNIFKIERICQDMLRTTHKVDLVNVMKNDVFDTKECKIRSANFSYAPVRYFYKHLNLPQATRQVDVREPQDYAKAFVSKYLKTKQAVISTTNKDRQRIGQIVELALNDKAEITVFYHETGHDLSYVDFALKDLKSDVLRLLTDNDNFSAIIEEALLRNDELKNELISKAKEIWLKQSDEMRSSVEESLSFYETELANAKKSYEDSASLSIDLEKNIAELNEIKIAKQQELVELKSKLSAVQSDIQNELINFQNNIVHLASMSAFSNNQSIVQPVNKGFVAKEGMVLEPLECGTAESIKIFTEDLQSNLITSGVKDSAAVAVSMIITSTILSTKNLIIDSSCDKVADSIAALIDCKESYKLFITDSVADVSTLVDHINSLDSTVILIYGLLDAFSEKSFTALSHLCKEKFIVFACEDIEAFEVLPSHWWKYATLLSLKDIVSLGENEEYESYSTNESFFRYKQTPSLDIEDVKRTISVYSKKHELSQAKSTALFSLLVILKDTYREYKIAQQYLLHEENNNDEKNDIDRV